MPFAFGLGLLAAIFAFGHISGGHFNPAVTVAMILDKRAPAVEGVGYIVAQIIGAIAAAVVVMLTVSQEAVAAGITKPGAGITDISALIIEMIFTAIFLTVILVVVASGTGTLAAWPSRSRSWPSTSRSRRSPARRSTRRGRSARRSSAAT